MLFRQFLDDRLGCCSYLVASETVSEAAVIDPGHDIELYERILHERKLRLRYVIDTHIHADHLSGARALAAAHDAALCLHEVAITAYPFCPLRDEQELSLGQIRLRVLHTAGHRPELISLLVVDLDRGSEPLFVCTADSLLVGDAGRPDFQGGNPAAQFDSVRRLLDLPEWVALFPGHFKGPCGAAMHGAPSTTIGIEKRLNRLARLNRTEFVAELEASVPPRPLNSTAIEAANRGQIELTQWAMLTTRPVVPERSATQLAARYAETFIVDVREPEEFLAVHVPESVNIPQADLAIRLDELPRDQPIACICRTGRRSLYAAKFLSQAGFNDVSNIQGGIAAWLESGHPAIASR